MGYSRTLLRGRLFLPIIFHLQQKCTLFQHKDRVVSSLVVGHGLKGTCMITEAGIQKGPSNIDEKPIYYQRTPSLKTPENGVGLL